MTTASRTLRVIAFLCVLGATGFGQGCFIGDDGFDTGCCNTATATLPSFPSFTMQANWAELRGCAPTNLNTVNMFIGAPTMVFCDYALLGVFVVFPNGETISGTLVAKYVRTWIQLPAPTGQIWRFLVNGDLQCAPIAGSTPCTSPLPRCAFSSPPIPVHFDGHIDYRCDQTSTTGTFSASLSLTHHQGCLSHPFWSCVPIAGVLGHNESSYHLVGPAPFFFAPGVAPQGPLLADSVRTSFLRTVPSFVYQCMSEEKVGPFGSLTTSSSGGCLCATLNQCTGNPVPCTAATSCYEHQSLNFFTCCPTGTGGGPHQNFPVTIAPLNQTGFLALRLGTWGALPQYPAFSSLTVYFGLISYTTTPGCPTPNWPFHLAVGVATSNAFALPFTLTPACMPPAPPSSAWIDLANVLPLTGGAFLTPGYGCLAASDVVWSFNTP